MKLKKWFSFPYLTILFTVALVLLIGCCGFLYLWRLQQADQRYPDRIAATSEQFDEIWQISCYIQNFYRNFLTVSEEVIWIGDYLPSEDYSGSLLVAADLSTGTQNWQVPTQISGRFAHNSSYVYGGTSRGIIVAHDIYTGEIVWQTNLPIGKSVYQIAATESNVFVNMVPASFYVLDATTGIIQSSRPAEEASPIFFIEDNVMYWQPLPLYLQALDTQTNRVLWQTELTNPFDEAPVFTDGLIYVRLRTGYLVVLESSTGTILWSTPRTEEDRLASHVAVSNGVVYFLTDEAHLKAIDAYTGTLLGKIKIGSSLLELPEHDYFNLPFEVATSDDKVVVYFGDTQQLFAFRFVRN
jgi:outer membrane protein assembly factor BamB